MKYAIRQLRSRGVLANVAVLAVVVAVPATVYAWGRGFDRVKTAAEEPAAATGYGPGWVGLSYKTNGPIVGYLFAQGFRFGDGSVKAAFDHMDIRDTATPDSTHPTITQWPWGYAHGSFAGCAFAYGARKFELVRQQHSSSSCAGGPNAGPRGTWWHDETVFCTDNRTDPLCSPAGVWSDGKPEGNGGTKPVTSKGCQAFANIGALAAYGRGAAAPAHPLGFVAKGQSLSLRYVTRDRQWVMAMWNTPSFPAGIRWAFFPRSCVQ